MRLAPFFLLACLGLAPACGSSSDGDPGTGGSNAGGSGGTAVELEPAPNIDVTMCAAIREGDTDALNQCFECCDLRPEVVASSFIHRGQCTCAELREDDAGETICASATADGDTCGTCCSDHDYLGYGWVGGGGTSPAVCGCGSHQDRTVCAASARAEAECANCCMHAGYIGTGYGSGTCICSGP
jgi:hypothetical protein